MKRKLQIFVTLILACCCVFLCAFTFDRDSSLKSLTHPFINTYECKAARLGKEDLMEKYEYIKITFLDDKKLEVSMKKKKGKRHAYTCAYDYDEESGNLSAEIGILGFRFKQRTQIKDGKFTLSMPILGKPLIMNFSA